MRKKPSSCDCPEIRTHGPTSEGFEVTGVFFNKFANDRSCRLGFFLFISEAESVITRYNFNHSLTAN